MFNIIKDTIKEYVTNKDFRLTDYIQENISQENMILLKKRIKKDFLAEVELSKIVKKTYLELIVETQIDIIIEGIKLTI